MLHLEGTTATIDYEPAESTTAMFGGNSNWRGPIWFPLNYLVISCLQKYHDFFGDDFTVEYPTGSGNKLTLAEIADDLSGRLVSIFTSGADGRRPCYGWVDKLQHDPKWRDNVYFNEYFHGDNGAGLGASHQTGWTGLIADVIRRRHGAVPETIDLIHDLLYPAGRLSDGDRERHSRSRPCPGTAPTLARRRQNGGVNFAVASTVAEEVTLCLFDDRGKRPGSSSTTTTRASGTASCPVVGPGQAYGYRVNGPFDPPGGCAATRASCSSTPTPAPSRGGVTYGHALLGHDRPTRRRPGPLDSAPFVPGAWSIEPAGFDWEGDASRAAATRTPSSTRCT